MARCSGAGGEAATGGEAGAAPFEGDLNVACLEGVERFCDAVYACLSADDLFALNLPDTADGCVENLSSENGCSASDPVEFCGGSKIYDPRAAVDCASQSRSATCEQIQSGEEFAPSCNLVCLEP